MPARPTTSPSRQLLARAIVHHEGKSFIVEFKFDVATCARRGTVPRSSTWSTDVRDRQPASAGSDATRSAGCVCPRESLLVAGHDGRGYETRWTAA